MLKNILAVILGIVIGSIVNYGLIIAGAQLIPAPEGVDPMNADSIQQNIHLFLPRHFLFPFLAHALGTLVGAAFCAKIAKSHYFALALGVGGFFMLGGIINAFMIPAPSWFMSLDLIVAYLP
ncbi:MAG: hypothetical protein ACPF8V_09075, partial [Luteibaculum sp.]